ncbi:MAG: GT4 family glycosyltransferase PelF [Pseudomonadota bacterium]
MSDVCLVLEGTYPYIRGGVSAWVHDIITEMPDVKFSVLSIMPTPRDTRIERYELPSNVQSLINIYIHDHHFRPRLFKKRTKRLFDFFEMFYRGIEEVPKAQMEIFLLDLLKGRSRLDLAHAFSSRQFWNAVLSLYNKGDTTISFLDYFWNYRFTFLPVMQILKANLPPAPLYHTISTGYAGVACTLAKIKFNSNMIVTEHGIYTKERRIEIAQAGWIYERVSEYVKATEELGYFKDWWTRYFSAMSKLAYAYADSITTLFEGNRQLQIADGADPKKTMIIPNGVDVGAFQDVLKSRKKKGKRRTIAFIGRIVPIKDVKTLIKACKIIVQKLPDVRVLLIGPQEEESKYFQDCSALIKMMGLEENMVFTGHVDVKDYLTTIDVILLTSISEAQPLVILEAAASGVPTVASDVGSCRELIEGKTEVDRALGPGGIVCQFHSPERTAEATIRLLTDDEMYGAMSRACCERVRLYYNKKDMITAYRNLYEQYI